jgi:hypothetical protein
MNAAGLVHMLIRSAAEQLHSWASRRPSHGFELTAYRRGEPITHPRPEAVDSRAVHPRILCDPWRGIGGVSTTRSRDLTLLPGKAAPRWIEEYRGQKAGGCALDLPLVVSPAFDTQSRNANREGTRHE